MDQQRITYVALGMAVVTFVPRFLPALLLNRLQLPQALVVWLRYIPPAVMACLLAQWLVPSAAAGGFAAGKLFLQISVPTFLVAYFTRNFLGTIVVGRRAVILA